MIVFLSELGVSLCLGYLWIYSFLTLKKEKSMFNSLKFIFFAFALYGQIMTYLLAPLFEEESMLALTGFWTAHAIKLASFLVLYFTFLCLIKLPEMLKLRHLFSILVKIRLLIEVPLVLEFRPIAFVNCSLCLFIMLYLSEKKYQQLPLWRPTLFLLSLSLMSNEIVEVYVLGAFLNPLLAIARFLFSALVFGFVVLILVGEEYGVPSQKTKARRRPRRKKKG